jgi:MFS family permease
LFGAARRSYLLLASSTTFLVGLIAGLSTDLPYWRLALLYTGMGLGLAFTDVLADALMVESGKPRGLTGAFQSVQWASITCASVLVGALGGHFAEHRDLHTAFIVAAAFPLAILLLTALFVREAPVRFDRTALREERVAARRTGGVTVWLVAAFILLFNFSRHLGRVPCSPPLKLDALASAVHQCWVATPWPGVWVLVCASCLSMALRLINITSLSVAPRWPPAVAGVLRIFRFNWCGEAGMITQSPS